MHIFYYTFKKYAYFFSLFTCAILAENKVLDLSIDYKTLNFTGETVQALAVNDQIPGPTLRFTEGDHVVINVHNHLKEGTTIHWHGLIIPWKIDGVEGVSQNVIPPGETFKYEFTLKQSGTYWYHAHAGLQEQRGVYGAFIIDPVHEILEQKTDYVIILSDSINTLPEKVFANLKNDGDYYTRNFPLQPSLFKFLHDYENASPENQKKLKNAYEMMQEMRMSPYDISDIAYDAILLNGHTTANPWTAPVTQGESVRLRFIGAGASTIFKLKIPDTKMTIIQVQGNTVNPHDVDFLTIAPGETYDVLISIQKSNPYAIYVESLETLRTVYGVLLPTKGQKYDFSTIKKFTEPTPQGMKMDHMSMSGMEKSMSHTGHKMTMNNTISIKTLPQNIAFLNHRPKQMMLINLTKKYICSWQAIWINMFGF